MSKFVWVVGAVLFPIDHRLPPAEVDALLAIDLVGGGRRPREVVGALDGGVPATPRGDALLVATSGTAGAPEIVRASREASVDAAVAASALALEADPHDPWLCCLPLSDTSVGCSC